MTLKETRKNCKLTQEEAAKVVGTSLRTYVTYEKDESKADHLKLSRMIEILNEYAAKDTSILKDKVLLITGGTGSFGHAVVDNILISLISVFKNLSTTA